MLSNRNIFAETDVGEVVVYNVKGKDIPIVHRVVRRFGTGSVKLHCTAVWRYGALLLTLLVQTGCEAPHKRRQQCGRRY